MLAVNLRIRLKETAGIKDYLLDNIFDCAFPIYNGMHDVIIKNVDEILVESLREDELVEFFGIDADDVVSVIKL